MELTEEGRQSVRGRAVTVPGVNERSVLPPAQYVSSLAGKRMAAAAFFRDARGRVLLPGVLAWPAGTAPAYHPPPRQPVYQ